MKIKFFNTPKKVSAAASVWRDFEKNPPAFLTLPARDFSAIQKFAASARKKWRQVLILGIGGSALPAQVLVNALRKPPFRKGGEGGIFFLDNLDPAAAAATLARIDLKKTLVLVISKSGGTLETLANFFVVRKLLGKRWKKQTVFLTDPKKGFLRELAKRESLTTFEIPAEIGGRFSIFSPVGLLPAALAGGNLRKLLRGAAAVKAKQAFEFAKIHAAEFRRGKNIAVFCVYASALEALARWYEQLLAESVGKSPRVGITPTIAVGAAAQHSLLQLWADGPSDKFFIFTRVRGFAENLKVAGTPPEFSFLKNKSFVEILNVEAEATIRSLAERQRPLAVLEIPELVEFELGKMLQFWMLEVYFLARILGVNPFDQPGVERGKVLAKRRLARNC